MYATGARAAGITDKWIKDNYSKTEVMIPMRDGISLYTAIYKPKDSTRRHPVIMQRTPYALRPYGKGYAKALREYLYMFLKHNYIVIFQNVRGTFLSEGEYENIRPLGKTIDAVDEATDTYDTVEWILQNTYCNGAIGVKGTSYPGFYATLAAVARHPAIKAVSPQAPVADWFMGDDVHHNGAFLLADMYRFGGSFFRPKNNPTIRSKGSLVTIDKGIYDFFLEKGSMQNLMAPYGDSLKFWNLIKNHPDYDSFWKERNPVCHLKNIKPAVMVVGGTFDAEDCYGAFATYRGIESLSPDTELYMVIGPWAHGAWKSSGYSNLAGAYFGEGSASYFMEEIEYPFFAYYLENGDKPISKVNVLFSGDTSEKGQKEQWESYDSWPPMIPDYKRYYFASEGKLNEKPTGGTSGYLSYVSDPANPVPYYNDNEATERIRDYMAADQGFLKGRKDVLSFIGPEINKQTLLAGPVKVVLSASTSTTDADFVVKIIDVRPDGYQMLVRGDVMPARYRNGFEKAEPMQEGKVERIEFTMSDIAHIIKPGHRLMVQVQSSWYPLVAMNPQQCVENQYYARNDDYVKSEIRIYFGKDLQSYIELPEQAVIKEK